MPDLIVNLDYLAVLREKRQSREPDPVAAAVIAEMAGATGIAVTLRGDRRFVQERDVQLLREMVKTRLYLGMVPSPESIKFAYQVKPDWVVLLPERHEEVSSSIGLDVLLNQSGLKKVIRALKEVGVRVSILVDPDQDQVKSCASADADGVLLNTRLYADTGRQREVRDELDRIESAAHLARKLRMEVVAGHGIDFHNVAPVATLADVTGVEIGHGMISRATFRGLDAAVREMSAAIVEARRQTPPAPR